MKAAFITGYGEPPVLRDVAPPEAGDDTELVEIEVAGINPVDIAIASGKFDSGAPPLPYVTGKEAVGRTSEGRRVWFDEARYPSGSFAEVTEINLGSGIELPEEIESAQAVAFGVAGMAAWLALTWRGHLKAGETVLVNGASGSVGQIAIQAARLLGASRVIGTARSESGLARVESLGADAAISTESDTFGADLVHATEGGADLVIDNLWGEPALAAIDAMRAQGRLVQVGNSAGTHASIQAGRLRGGLITITGHRNFWAPREDRVEAFQRMCAHSIAGKLEIDVEVCPLSDVADVWKRQAASPGHKLALDPRL